MLLVRRVSCDPVNFPLLHLIVLFGREKSVPCDYVYHVLGEEIILQRRITYQIGHERSMWHCFETKKKIRE